MSNSIKLVFLTVLVLLDLAKHGVNAYSEAENFAYIRKILTKLNNNRECDLPTYEEVDELQKSFSELERTEGEHLTDKLSADEKLVRQTLLDQWESFQKRMTSAVVIRSAKRRAFLCKVEEYQKAKFGSSICTQIADRDARIIDRIFERNPLVRYIKHLETHEVPERPDGDGKGDVIHTLLYESPIVKVSIDEYGKKREFSDPLADVPVPPLRDSMPNSELNDGTQSIPERMEESKLVQPIHLPELENGRVDYELSEMKEEKLDDAIGSEKSPLQLDDPDLSKKPEAPEESNKIGDSEIEYVDDEMDDKDLDRLERVPAFEEEIIYSDLKWPDEGFDGSKTIDGDESVNLEWEQFLKEIPDAIADEIGPAGQADNAVDTATPSPDQEMKTKVRDLRRRKKDFLKMMQVEQRMRDRELNIGLGPEKPARWVEVVDGNFCRVSYNRNYLSGTRPVKTVKSLFSRKKLLSS